MLIKEGREWISAHDNLFPMLSGDVGWWLTVPDLTEVLTEWYQAADHNQLLEYRAT